MKASEAPEKIYLDIEPNLDDCTWHLTNPNGDSIEYTHTDAFIEKAAKWLDETLRNTDFYEDEIELMVQDFKKAMKS